ncbi:translation factor [Mollisia scopiformis]|uniref:Threonylcarbamoyl-AMP synthase n=1 Tax=Mollisia scopiformis TaxID=149040 RepID=A0A194XW39_MOLSC|nr:translation factor [Mollisia scopiformis]KUJ23937.1 translation factor [Mollisia scopiformis]
MAVSSVDTESSLNTRVLPVDTSNMGKFEDRETLETWTLPNVSAVLEPLQIAAKHLRETSIPVGFPTETVYGLGADATRSDAVKGIYKAKGRPSDNPLIIHVCDLTMLRDLIHPSDQINGNGAHRDPIPAIYKPLIKRFWPGPLTILLPNPKQSKLAPEVTAGLTTFGARMPESPLALSLIYIAGVPLAAPSANASTKPSPTTAEHVLHDMKGRIEIILDGGPCQVGVESTVVDGLCDPPVVLRPGGVSIDDIRECEGWSGVVKGYKDQSEIGASAPRAPGMKYKHYSPKAKVVLYESGALKDFKAGIPLEVWKIIEAKHRRISHLGYENLGRPATIGIVCTKNWSEWAGFHNAKWSREDRSKNICTKVLNVRPLDSTNSYKIQQGELWQGNAATESSPHGEGEIPDSWDLPEKERVANIIEISLGKGTKDIAHGLFSALRELDQKAVDVIYVEGIEDEGDIAAAVMNRLRKAATVIEK